MGLLARLGLDDPKVRAWAMYDWANSAFVTVVITAVYPTYTRASSGTFSLATTIALTLAAILGPILGTLSDVRPVKKRLLGAGILTGVLATAALALLPQDQALLGLVLFGTANIGLNISQTAYDALLPHVAKPEKADRVSAAGYALGYLGGGLILAVVVALVLALPDKALAAKLGFALTALWWLIFSIPIWRRVPEPPPSPVASDGPLLATTFRVLGGTYRQLRRYPQAFLLLVAFLVYNDGVGTIFRMAAIFGRELELPTSTTISAILAVQFIGLPCTFLYAGMASKIGTRTAILLGLGVYCGISILGYFMGTPALSFISPGAQFMTLAVLVGLVQGGVQALSRSLFSRLTPKARSGEFFGLFAVFEKFAGILGPALFTIAIHATGSSRTGILSVVAFFVIGGALLLRVNVREGEAAARAADAEDEAQAARIGQHASP